MAFIKRLGFYLIGLAIGLIFLAFFLNRKRAEFCYMPNCRVLKELRSKPLTYSESINEMIENHELDSTDVLRFLTDGDVDFRASDTKAQPCKIYIIESEIMDQSMVLQVENCDSLVSVIRLDPLPN